MRVSLGDFDFEASTYLTYEQNILFWIVWSMIVVMSSIIFLNFITSEIGMSYDSVSLIIDELVMQERACLISEAEQLYPLDLKND